MTKKKTDSTFSPLDQIAAYLKQHKDEHLNFEKEENYVVSSGSLLLDLAMSGGVRPSIIRASGVAEGGKTSCALSFAKNFQSTVDNSMAVYIKSEGRLSTEMIERSGIDTSEDKWFVYKSNIFESVLELIKELIHNNPTNRKYFFIIDSMDALVPKNDISKSFEESVKVAGGSVLSSNFLKTMALPLSSKGHVAFLISQVRSKVSINPYEKADPKLTNASGGNALLHYSDWILEFQPRWSKDMIRDKSAKAKSPPEGHWCRVVFRKTANEKTGSEVEYPIRYGRTGGKSIWVEYEILHVLLAFNMVKATGAWLVFEESLIKELKSKKIEVPEKVQGEDAFRKMLEENVKLSRYLFKKFRDTLKKAS